MSFDLLISQFSVTHRTRHRCGAAAPGHEFFLQDYVTHSPDKDVDYVCLLRSNFSKRWRLIDDLRSRRVVLAPDFERGDSASDNPGRSTVAVELNYWRRTEGFEFGKNTRRQLA